MRRTCLAVALVVCMLAGTALAGGAPTTEVGTKQLVFKFKGFDDLNLSEYNGGLGFRYFFKPDMALRPGVDISFFKETFKSQDSNVRDEEDSFNRIAFSAVLEKYMPSYHSIAPYVGVGAGYERSKEVDQDSGEPKDSKQECVTTRSAFDVVGVAGFQWFFTEGLSLGGEYSGTFFFGSGKEESTYDAGTTTTTDEYSNSGLTWEAFSVYFSVKF